MKSDQPKSRRGSESAASKYFWKSAVYKWTDFKDKCLMSHWYFWRIGILLLRCHCYFRVVVFHLLFSNRLLSSKEILLGNPVYETDTSHNSGWIVWQKASFCQGPQSTSSVLPRSLVPQKNLRDSSEVWKAPNERTAVLSILLFILSL